MPNWPQRWGGPDRTPTQRAILAGELALDHAPEGASIGFERGDPVLIHHGSPALPTCDGPETADLALAGVPLSVDARRGPAGGTWPHVERRKSKRVSGC